MKVTEVAAEIALRHDLTAEKTKALASDLRAAGISDGLPLHEAFDEWRAKWVKRSAPTAGEFKAFYRMGERIMSDKERRSRPDGAAWANKVFGKGGQMYAEGKYALERGVGSSTWLWCRDNPGEIPQRDWIDDQRTASERAALALNALPAAMFAKAMLERLQAAMGEREQRFAADLAGGRYPRLRP